MNYELLLSDSIETNFQLQSSSKFYILIDGLPIKGSLSALSGPILCCTYSLTSVSYNVAAN